MSDPPDKSSKDSEFKKPAKRPNARQPSTATPLPTRSRSTTPSGASAGATKKPTPTTSRASSTSSTGSRTSSTTKTTSKTTKPPAAEPTSRTTSPSRLTPPPASSTFADGGAAAAAAAAFLDESSIPVLEATVVQNINPSEDKEDDPNAEEQGSSAPPPDEEEDEGQESPNQERDEDPPEADPNRDKSPSDSDEDEEDSSDNMADTRSINFKDQTSKNVTLKEGKGDLWDQLIIQRKAGKFITDESALKINRIYKDIPTVNRTDAHTVKTILSSYNHQYQNVKRVDAALKDLLADEESYETFHKFSRESLGDMEIVIDKGQRILKSSSITDTGDPALDATFNALSPQVTVNTTSGAIDMTSTSKSSSRRTRKDSDDDEGTSYAQPRKHELDRMKWDGSKQTYANFKRLANQVLGPPHYTYLTRFTCLKEVLPDKQAKVMEAYPYDAKGYLDFWSYLDRTFQQKPENVSYWLNKLNYLKTVEESNGRVSLPQLEVFYTSLKLIISKLEENGRFGKDNHEEWKATITSKLPQSYSVVWNKKYKKIVLEDDPTVDPIQEQLKFLEEELDILRISVSDFNMRKTFNSDHNKKSKEKDKSKQEQSYATVTTGEGKGKKKKKKGARGFGNEEYKSTAPSSCMLCDESNKKHHPKDCKKPAKDAWSRLYAQKACGGCGNVGHGIYNCQSKTKCTKEGCTWHHLVNLHDIPFLKKKDWAAKQKK